MNWKEIAKAFLLTLLLIPLIYFGCGMLSASFALLIASGEAYHHPGDLQEEAALAAMTISMIASVGFTLAIIPLAYFRLHVLPRWVAVVGGIILLGFIWYGNTLYHEPGKSVTDLILMILLLPIPPGCAAGFVFRFARARHPARISLLQPLLWAFGSILVTSISLALVTVFLGGLPLSEMPER